MKAHHALPPRLPLDIPPRPVERETIAVWRAVVALRKRDLRLNENWQVVGELHTVYRLSRRTHVVDGRQLTTREMMKLARGITRSPQPSGDPAHGQAES